MSVADGDWAARVRAAVIEGLEGAAEKLHFRAWELDQMARRTGHEQPIGQVERATIYADAALEHRALAWAHGAVAEALRAA